MDRFVARTAELIVEELDGGLVIYDARDTRAHYLDSRASAMWRACHHPRTGPEIFGDAGLDATSGEMVLEQLIDLGLVETESGSRYSRRVVLRTAAKVGLGGAMAAPIISAIVPAAAAAASAIPGQTGQTPLTPGYWKNHSVATTALLPQSLGNFNVSTFTDATNVFDNMNMGGSNVFNGLAGHLLAAELNVANGAAVPCAQQAISEANAFLLSVSYTGPFGSYAPTSSQRTEAVSLATLLENYNQGSLTC